MWLWIAILMTLVVIAYRILTRKWRHARKVRKRNRKRAKAHHGYNRTVKRRGSVVADKYCTDCGLPESRCRRKTGEAEHAEGMIGKKKK